MAKKKKAPDAGPSKAYLVSFGDTMTALLAFFIVLNSLANEQTGAKMHAGTGSFVRSFSKSGAPGSHSGNRSRDMIQATAQAPIYALAENLDKNTRDNVGPDDTYKKDRIFNREKENFQKFLTRIDREYGLETHPPILDQTVFDTFSSFKKNPWGMSDHARQLTNELVQKVRNEEYRLEIIVWTPIPGKATIDRTLIQSMNIQTEVENLKWLRPEERRKIRYVVKPWLFSDAKRPTMSFVLSKQGKAN